jgi:hypothetical protein
MIVRHLSEHNHPTHSPFADQHLTTKNNLPIPLAMSIEPAVQIEGLPKLELDAP